VSKFYERLSYSFGNEDPFTEIKALSVKKEDTVVCVTASGDRPLNLMAQDLGKIYAIDLNPIQNHLLSLKIQAMQQLDFEDYLSFLGASNDPYPIAFVDSILNGLPKDAKEYWTSQRDLIENGILYQGAMEKLCLKISTALNFFFKKEIQNLFSSQDIFTQQEYIDQLFEKKLLKFIARLVLNPSLTKKYFSDPGLYAFIDSGLKVHEYLLQRIKNCLEIHLVNENPLLHLLFLGKVKPEAFPPYLRKECVTKIKKNLSKLEIIHGNMIQFLESFPEKSVDCFSLSDIASYMNENDFNRLLFAMLKAAKPNARFCVRELMSNHQIHPTIKERLQLDSSLAEELKVLDRCFVYRFLVGQIA
jgi:S-adenosylmethionine-diacylglycerol 3-amino-3-carboxypropyl transferase